MARIITPEAKLSYPHLFKPQKPQSGEGDSKYGCALVFPEGTDITPMKQAAFNAVVEQFGKEKAAAELKSGNLRLVGGPHHAIRNDVEGKYPKGTVGYINARSKQQPGIVSIYPDPETGRPMPVTDESKVYPGVIVRASVTPYWYDYQGNRGVGWGLNNLQVIRDGERLDGRVPAEDEFSADEDAVADLSDLDVDAEMPDEEDAGGGDGDFDLNELLG